MIEETSEFIINLNSSKIDRSYKSSIKSILNEDEIFFIRHKLYLKSD